MSLTISQLQLGYHGQCSVQLDDLNIVDGAINCIIGPNGCGKSTLLRGLSGLLTPLAGEVLFKRRALTQWPRKELAKQLSILPQNPQPPVGISLSQLVMQGRFPHQSLLGSGSKADVDACEWAMDLTVTSHLKERMFDQLSGGERQRGWIAMALAQQTEYLLLDEPNTFLDIGHQLDVMHLLRRLNQQQRMTIVVVLHEINHACQFADHLIVMKAGQLVAQGRPQQVVSAELLNQVFRVNAEILTRQDQHHQFPFCIVT